MKKELASKYDHKSVEKGKYQHWLEKEYFKAGDVSKKPYAIVIPPPNVTGKLHLGHAWDTTLQDMIIRYKRMQGYDALWLPGMDHAGIATQAKVEARMREEGISRYDLGREGFLEKAWSWKEEYASIIRAQWEKLGLSLDYSKERFTLDEGLSQAVKEVFVRLYEKGYIYQGKRIINWDPVQRTALSNIEVIHKEIEGAMYYFKYKIVDSDQELVIATTRPETMFADQAIFVHPDDERYKDLVGKYAINPANGEKLPIMADSYIDMDFGTAVMKCTPAHDPNDFALAKKYNLDMPICMNDDGTMNELCHKYQGMDRFECRKQLVADFEAAGIVDHIEKHLHQVGHSERSGAIVEPYLSKQWFVKMKPLAEAALANQKKDSKVNFVPERFEKTFTQWMENIEDWCISRQLWWGHQVPAWYHKETGEVYVGKTAPEDTENWTQDEDVLDTWFSSALWPFSTLGWPNTEDPLFKRYFPTNTLVTGYDIIFFWVARMIFSAIEHTGKAPFKNVFIHGIVRDSQGRKMSKSLGNGIDPIEVIDKYGTDALRFSLILGISPGNDIRYMPEKLEAASNFANKLWNASKFVLGNLENYKEIEFKDIKDDLTYADKWILSKLNVLVAEITNNIDGFELGVFAQKIYDFIWNEFCDWYIEMVKPRLYNENDKTKLAAMYTLNKVLADSLKLLHPIMPFITEEIYTKLYNNDESIMISKWPEYDNNLNYEKEIQAVEELKNIIIGIRNIRVQRNVHPSKKSKLIFVTSDLKETVKDSEPWLLKLGFGSEIQVKDNKEEIPQNAMAVLANGVELYMPFEELVDIVEEKERLQKEKERLQSEIQRATKMLSNPGFVNKAPAEKIQEEKDKKAKYEDMLVLVESRLLEIGNKS